MKRVLAYIAGASMGATLFVMTLWVYEQLVGQQLETPIEGMQNFWIATGLILGQAILITAFAYRAGLQEGYLLANEDATRPSTIDDSPRCARCGAIAAISNPCTTCIDKE